MPVHVRQARRVAVGVLTVGWALAAAAPVAAAPDAAGPDAAAPEAGGRAQAAVPQVTVTELLPPEGSPPDTILVPLDVNNEGQVVGAAYQGSVGSQSRPFLWDGGRATWLPTPDEDDSYRAEHINDRGEVLVEASGGGAYRWFDGEVVDLRATGDEYVTTVDLNQRGQALITRSTGSGSPLAPSYGVWEEGAFTPIVPDGQWEGWRIDPAELSDTGHVAGTLRPVSPIGFRTNAFVWHDGAFTLLGDLESTRALNSAMGVNTRGDVVGQDVVEGDVGGTLWRDDRAVRLGFPPADINDRGQVVGTSYSVPSRALLWEGGRTTTLPGLGGDSSTAEAINERGQAVGLSRTRDGTYHYALWTGGRVVDLGAIGPYAADAKPLLLNDEGQVAGQLPTADGVRAVLWTVDDGSGDPGGAACFTATNAEHVQARRATSWLWFAWAAGSGQYLGSTSATTSLRQAAPGRWETVPSC